VSPGATVVEVPVEALPVEAPLVGAPPSFKTPLALVEPAPLGATEPEAGAALPLIGIPPAPEAMLDPLPAALPLVGVLPVELPGVVPAGALAPEDTLPEVAPGTVGEAEHAVIARRLDSPQATLLMRMRKVTATLLVRESQIRFGTNGLAHYHRARAIAPARERNERRSAQVCSPKTQNSARLTREGLASGVFG
jgi:hypothetical protein